MNFAKYRRYFGVLAYDTRTGRRPGRGDTTQTASQQHGPRGQSDAIPAAVDIDADANGRAPSVWPKLHVDFPRLPLTPPLNFLVSRHRLGLLYMIYMFCV